ncbi:MAG: hypothetical protein QXM27_00025 [Candidatus Pacearchaeota archaeon]
MKRKKLDNVRDWLETLIVYIFLSAAILFILFIIIVIILSLTRKICCG